MFLSSLLTKPVVLESTSENSTLATLTEGLERLREDHAELRPRVDLIPTEMGLFSRKLDDLIRMINLGLHGVKLMINFKPSDWDHVTSVTNLISNRPLLILILSRLQFSLI